jgi:hypothetical protein
MYIGNSLGRCLNSILRGEVSSDEVLCIITRTRAEDYSRYIEVVKQYYDLGDSVDYGYNLSIHDWEQVKELATELWYAGKIHQPRLYISYVKSVGPGDIWLEVVPTNKSTNQAVVDAYEKYRILASLTK